MAKVETLRRFVRPKLRPVLKLSVEDIDAFIKANTPEAYFVFVTPEIAEALMERMGPNRGFSDARCDKLVRDQLDDNFETTNQGIGIDVEGKVFDGQHRLVAITRSGMSQVLLVVIGLSVEAQSVIDGSKPRTFADEQAMKGEPRPGLVAASVQWLYNIKASRPDTEKDASGQRIRFDAATRSELSALLDKHPGIRESCETAIKCRLSRQKEREDRRFLRNEVKDLLPPGLLVAVHYVGSQLQKDRDAADLFLERLTKFPNRIGSESKDDAAYVWAKHLYDKRIHKNNERTGRSVKAVGTIHAWRLFRDGKKLKTWQDVSYSSFGGLNYDLL
jgi:hypothetical protein